MGEAEKDDKLHGAPPPAGAAKKRRLRPSLVVLAVALLLVIIAIVQNLEKTHVSFLWMDAQVGLWLLVTISVLLGVVIGAGLHIHYARGKRRTD